ncbi:MAG: hypothetical protein C5B51_06965 [Terriglobia bacterium]|nr:MAG: hypothetical protein C5B51_06965 [Terriglobia bacterium]
MKRRHVWMVVTGFALSASLCLRAQTTSPDTPITGPGKAGYVPLWLGSFKQGNSNIFQNGSGNLGIGTAAPGAPLDVNGAVNTASGFNLGGAPFAFGSLANGNAFLGFSGNSTTTGIRNTASGVSALQSNTTGVYNTATGAFALYNNTEGFQNDAHGYGALAANTTGQLNTAMGVGALGSNTSGSQNAAFGAEALQNNTTGVLNTALGIATLPANTTGYYNTAVGWSALKNNTTGAVNTASGYGALAHNITGNNNGADGFLALYNNTTGSQNTAMGLGALQYNVTGSYNTALGYGAGPDINSTGLSNATAVGANAVVSQSNALVLGSPGVNVGIGTPTPSNVFTIAKGAGQAISDGWIVYSSRRWKTNIQTLDGALGKVEQLRGVSYDRTDSGKHEVGVIAEEVGAVVPEVVTWDGNGQDVQGVDYSRLTALLIEATKEQQFLIREQQQQIQAQQEQIAQLASQVKTVRDTWAARQ